MVPNILFFGHFKATKFLAEYFCNCLNIGYASFCEKKNEIGRVVFVLISIISIIAQCLYQKCQCIYVVQVWAKFCWKILLGKWFFKFLSLFFFGCHFETVQIFFFFLLEYGYHLCMYIWCENNLKIPIEMH